MQHRPVNESMSGNVRNPSTNRAATDAPQQEAEPSRQDSGIHIHRLWEGDLFQSPHNVGTVERWVSLVGGGGLLFALLRKSIVFVAAAWLAGYLVYRGISGRCTFYAVAQVDGRRLDRWFFRPASPNGTDEEKIKHKQRAASVQDKIDEASFASFPASDPPATW